MTRSRNPLSAEEQLAKEELESDLKFLLEGIYNSKEFIKYIDNKVKELQGKYPISPEYYYNIIEEYFEEMSKANDRLVNYWELYREKKAKLYGD